jgi:hypothetical protein
MPVPKLVYEVFCASSFAQFIDGGDCLGSQTALEHMT